METSNQHYNPNHAAYLQDLQLRSQHASESAKYLIDEEIIEKQKELVKEGQKLSIFLSFFITTLVVLFFMALLVYTFQSLQDDLFEASPFVQVLTLASPVVALLALSIIFNFKRITSPVLFKLQQILFYPVDFAYKVWSEEFLQEFTKKEHHLNEVIETQEDVISGLEDKIQAQKQHAKNLENILQERMLAQDYSEAAMRALLEHLGEYVLFIDPHGFIPDYYSRSVLNLVNEEPQGESFSKIANFNHQQHVEFISFLSHYVDDHMDFYRLEALAPKRSEYQLSQQRIMAVNWRYRPYYYKNGKLKAVIAIGNKENSDTVLQETNISTITERGIQADIGQYVVNAKSLNLFATELSAKTDLKLKKSFEENVLKQPLKTMINKLETFVYQSAEMLGKEVEFDYYSSMDQKISIQSFQKAEPILSELCFFLLNRQLETPFERKQVGKVSCGQLQLEFDLNQFGDRGSFYRLKIDGEGLSYDQLKSDLMRAGFLQSTIDEMGLDFSLLFNSQLNQYYMESYMLHESTIAKPVDLSKIKAKMTRLRGSIKIDCRENRQTIIDLYLPESLG